MDAPVVAAVAALIAAAFSGLTLFLSGRRETRKWLRESLLDAQVNFLDASFAYPARRLYDYIGDFPADWVVGEQIDVSRYVAAYAKAHEAQNGALTRIRLLAGGGVVAAAENLHGCDERMTKRLLHEAPYPSLEEFRGLRLAQVRAREQFIDAARRAVHLSSGAPIRSSSLFD